MRFSTSASSSRMGREQASITSHHHGMNQTHSTWNGAKGRCVDAIYGTTTVLAISKFAAMKVGKVFGRCDCFVWDDGDSKTLIVRSRCLFVCWRFIRGRCAIEKGGERREQKNTRLFGKSIFEWKVQKRNRTIRRYSEKGGEADPISKTKNGTRNSVTALLGDDLRI